MGRKQKPSLNFSDHFPSQAKGSRVPTVVPEEIIIRPAYNKYESHYIPLRNPTRSIIAYGIADLLNRVAQLVAGRSSDARHVAAVCRLVLSRCNYSALTAALEEYAENDDIRYVRDLLASIADVKCSDCGGMIEPPDDHVCDRVARQLEARRAATANEELAQLLGPVLARRKR